MKKNNNMLYLGILFLASMFAELYAFIAFRENIKIILGITAVVLIIGYLFLDSFYNQLLAYKAEQQQEFTNSLKNIERLQKAIYMAIRKNGKNLREETENHKEHVSDLAMQLGETVKRAAKLAAKYNHEDNKNLALSQKENMQKFVKEIELGRKNIEGNVLDSADQRLYNDGNPIGSYDMAAIIDAINRNGEAIRFKVENGLELLESDLSEIRDILVKMQKYLKTDNTLIPEDMIQVAATKENIREEKTNDMILETEEMQDDLFFDIENQANHLFSDGEEIQEEEFSITEAEKMRDALSNFEKVKAEIPFVEIEAEDLDVEEVLEKLKPKRPTNSLQTDKKTNQKMASEKKNSVESREAEIRKKIESKYQLDSEQAAHREQIKHKQQIENIDKTTKHDSNKKSSLNNIQDNFEVNTLEMTEKSSKKSLEENKQLTQDEIATMITSVSTNNVEVKEAETPVDSNKQLTSDEIAALFASVGQ